MDFDYSFDGGSLSSDLPDTASGGYWDAGVGLFDNIASKWLQYEDIKTRNDLEQVDDGRYGRAGAVLASNTGMLVLMAAGLAVVAFVVLRR